MIGNDGHMPDGHAFELPGLHDMRSLAREIAAQLALQLRPADGRGYLCPLCGSGPLSWSVSSRYPAPDGGFFCGQCGFHGDIIRLGRRAFGCRGLSGVADALNEGRSLYDRMPAPGGYRAPISGHAGHVAADLEEVMSRLDRIEAKLDRLLAGR